MPGHATHPEPPASDGEELHAADGTKFGRAMRDRFLLADGFTNFNHGSFGSVPKVVSEAQRAYSLQCEARPDKWFRQDYFVCVESARSMLAKYVNAPSPDDLVMVENASGAINSVMRSMNWEAGGIILYLSSAYAMVKNTASWLARTSGGTVEIVEVKLGPDFPMAGDDSVLNPLRDALKKHRGKVKLLVVDHITSVPAVTLPVAEILALARSSEVLGSIAAFPVLVDGAHALGQVDIDLQAMGDPDFYVSNAHKWLYAPKGSAFLYVRKDRQKANFPEPTVISSSGKQDFVGRYAYTGSRDYTPFCSVVNAFEFRASLGEEKIKGYVPGLAYATIIGLFLGIF
jgi:hercynylcysteine S-oxide lyase